MPASLFEMQNAQQTSPHTEWRERLENNAIKRRQTEHPRVVEQHHQKRPHNSPALNPENVAPQHLPTTERGGSARDTQAQSEELQTGIALKRPTEEL